MGQARIRKKEIEELKKHGRLIDTPRLPKPVLYRVGDSMWIIDNTDFKAWCDAAHANLDVTPIIAQTEFARLALIAERSGVKERECQAWYTAQCNAWGDRKLNVPVAKPVIIATSAK